MPLGFAAIDNLKMINDLRGHSTGDAVVARTSEAIRKSLRQGDESARLGDEFLIYALNCDTDGAVAIARAILKRLARQGMPLAGAPFSVSVGVAVHEGPGADFARRHRNADDALHQSKAEGRSPVVMFEPSTAAPLRPGHSPKVSA